MSIRTVRLTKGEHDYVFSYASGSEGQIVDEIMQLAADAGTDFDWPDAALLGFQVARHAAGDCRTEMASPSQVRQVSRGCSGAARGIGDDDAKDGPCTNQNMP